jgi:hypothetical protein
MARVKNEELVCEIGRKGITSAKRMFELANEFTDGEDAINASLGKYKRCNDKQAGKAPSSPKRKDHKRNGDFICNTKKEVAIGRSRATRTSLRRS